MGDNWQSQIPADSPASMCTLHTGVAAPVGPRGCRGYCVICTFRQNTLCTSGFSRWLSGLTSRFESWPLSCSNSTKKWVFIRTLKIIIGHENSLFIATSGRKWAAAWWARFSEVKRKIPSEHTGVISQLRHLVWKIIKTYWRAAVCKDPASYQR